MELNNLLRGMISGAEQVNDDVVSIMVTEQCGLNCVIVIGYC